MAESLIGKAQTTLAAASNITATPAFRDTLLVQYEAASSTGSMTNVPRFGHSREFASIFLSQEAQNDYVSGLLFVGTFILLFFGLWTLLLLLFKIFADGYISGKRFTLHALEPTKDQIDAFHRRCNRKRLIFALAGIVLIVFSVLLVSQGFQQVEQTRSTADKSLDDVRLLVSEASLLAEDLRDVGRTAVDLRDDLVIELEQDRLCPNDPNYLAQDEIGRAIEDNAGSAIEYLDMLGEFATKDIQSMENALVDANDIINDVDVVVEKVGENQWVGIVFVVPLVTFAALMMTGAAAAYAGVMNRTMEFALSWVILPLFILWIIASYVFSAGLALSASTNADFCAGGVEQTPEGTIFLSMLHMGYDTGDIEYEVARYYLRQCTAEAKEDPFLFLRQHEAEITSAQDIVEELYESLKKIDVEILSATCGRDFEPLSSSLDTMMDILDTLEKSATSGLALLSCERIVPIYASIVYEGTCQYSVTGLTWMFSSLLVIAAMGMIMILLRSSYLTHSIAADNGDPTDEDSEFRGMTRFAAGTKRLSQAEAEAAAYDLQLREHNRWREQALKKGQLDTSDSGSVYTDGNGDLVVTEIDASTVDHGFYANAPRFDSDGRPKASAPADDDYDERDYRNPSPLPTAPVEPQY